MLKLSEMLTGWQPGGNARVYEPVLLLEAGWDEIVGSEVAKHSRPARITDGTLSITTRSSAWSHQLSFLAEHVLQAIAARVPRAGIERLRFRVGTIRERARVASSRHPVRVRRPGTRAEDSGSASEALARFRRAVEQRRNQRHADGWKECAGCAALLAPNEQALCTPCAVAAAQQRACAAARLLFEAPWLGYTGTAALVNGLQEREYEAVRSQLLRHWWGILVQARAAKRLSGSGRERLVASSYVLLRSKLPPEEIMLATVRNVLGDELHDLLYGEVSCEGSAKNLKRKA